MTTLDPTTPPLFADVAGDVDVSFEFFPPKSEKMEETLWDSIETLSPLGPRFVSVTYGAGGTTRERTHATVARIARETAIPAAAHLTCVEATRAEIDQVATALTYWERAIELRVDASMRTAALEEARTAAKRLRPDRRPAWLLQGSVGD